MGTVPLIGGRAVIDLVNTVSWRGNVTRSQDHLQSWQDCLTWCTRTQVLGNDEARTLRESLSGSPAAADSVVRNLHELRTLVADSIIDTPKTRARDVEAVILDALAYSHLVADGDRHRWQVVALDEHTPRRRLGLDLYDLLTNTRGRLGVCADHDCRWAYLDTSKGQNRQWCSSTDCGNRHRARRHHQRHQHPSANP